MTWSRNFRILKTPDGKDVVLSVSVSTTSTSGNSSTERIFVLISNYSNLHSVTTPVPIVYNDYSTSATVTVAAQSSQQVHNFTRTTAHNADGSKVVTLTVGNTNYSITLDKLSGYASITSLTYTSDLNSATIKFNTDKTVDGSRWKIGSGGAWTTRNNDSNFTISNYGSPGQQKTLFLEVRRNGIWSATRSVLVTLKSLPKFTVQGGTYIGDTDTYTITGRIGTIVGKVVGNYWSKTFSTSANTGSITYTTADKQAIYEDYPNRGTAPLQRRIEVTQNGVTYRVVADRDDPKANPNEVAPSLPIFTHKDTNEFIVENLTGNEERYIKGYSDLEVALEQATAVYGATIKKYIVINGTTSQEYTSSGIKTVGKAQSNQLQVIVEDSRGLRSQIIKNINFIPYKQPTIQNFALNREIGTSTKADLITNGLYTDVNFGLVANKINKVEYRKKSSGDYGAWITLTGQVTYGGGLFVNAPTGNIDDFTFGVEFTVEIKVSDELSFNTRTATVSKGMFTMLIDQEYGSVGIGATPKQEENSLNIAGNVYAPNLLTKVNEWTTITAQLNTSSGTVSLTDDISNYKELMVQTGYSGSNNVFTDTCINWNKLDLSAGPYVYNFNTFNGKCSLRITGERTIEIVSTSNALRFIFAR